MQDFAFGVIVGMGIVMALWGHFELGRHRRTLDRPWEQDWRTITQRGR